MPENMKILWKILKWLCLAIVVLIIIFIAWFFLAAVDHPPEVKDLSALKTQRQEFGENIYFVGNNWLRKSESGLWEMYIEGDPFEAVRGESETLAGLILELTGEIPKNGHVIEVDGFTFRIESVDKRRIREIRVTIDKNDGKNPSL